MNSKAIIQGVINDIKEKKNEGILDKLRYLPIDRMPLDQVYKLSGLWLNAAYQNDNSSVVHPLMLYFDTVRSQVDPLPFITLVIHNIHLTTDAIRYILDCFPEKKATGFYMDLINSPCDNVALAHSITKFFPHVSHEDWVTLYRMTEDVEDEEYRNPCLRAFFERKVRETSLCAKPEWVKQLPYVPLEPYPNYIPNVITAGYQIISQLKDHKITYQVNKQKQVDIDHYDYVSDTITSQYAMSTAEEKIQMLGYDPKTLLFSDTPHFREYGPVNMMSGIYNQHAPLECTQYGGCRMLLCNEFETTTEDNETDIMAADEYLVSTDWFSKKCEVCKKIITQRHHAIRAPLLHGGWRGCYCSFICLRSITTDSQILLMIDRMEEQLNTIFIRDRDTFL